MGLRYYQQEAVDAVYNHLRAKDTNPCVVLPTASGKSWVLATISSDAVNLWNGRVAILAHVKELVEQNADKVCKLCDSTKVGIYSAGLNRRDTTQPIIVAGIQSVYNRSDLFGAFDLIIVDECHMIPADGEGMYRTFLKAQQKLNPNVRLIGLTATPFRLKGGGICKPENLLQEICYDVAIKRLIGDGYLSKLTTKASSTKAKLDDLHLQAGEFVASEVEEAMCSNAIISSACQEIATKTRDRNATIIFCTSVAHCKAVAAEITRLTGQECAVVTGETPAVERAETIARFRGDKVYDLFGEELPNLKYVANVECLTTGTDIPKIDCVALLRPTASPGLLLQMVGRGLRLSPDAGKTDCLVLDFGKNIERHGTIDSIRVKEDNTESLGRMSTRQLAKECQNCHELIHPAYMVCPACGYEFPKRDDARHETKAHTGGILSGETTTEWVDISNVSVTLHIKYGADALAPQTVRVQYYKNMLTHYTEWLCPEHTGYARQKFESWWLKNCPGWDIPNNAADCIELSQLGAIRTPKRIKVKTIAGEKFPKILDYEWPPYFNVTDLSDEEPPF